MTDSPSEQTPLRRLPPVHDVMAAEQVAPLAREWGHDTLVGWVREELSTLRQRIRRGEEDVSDDRTVVVRSIVQRLLSRANDQEEQRLGRVINATGVVLHTGLGRAPLSRSAMEAVLEIAGAGNVEVDLATGERATRGRSVLTSLRMLTGAEAALVVNNNAAATMLTLRALCRGREVLLSRGEMVEIGGSYRLPDVFEESGASLREVGTTNRTRVEDYERAITGNTAAILKVHPSNYHIEGFTEAAGIDELAVLAHKHDLLAIDDIGSGCLVDLDRVGLPVESTFSSSLSRGADLVLGSGDKLLGGPQAGIVVGAKELVDALKASPLARAFRVDKLTLAALEATLVSYRRGNEFEEIPILRLLGASIRSLRKRAEQIRSSLSPSEQWTITVEEATAVIGGGSLPGVERPTIILTIRSETESADSIALRLRTGAVRVFPRIARSRVVIDLRSVLREDDEPLQNALHRLLSTT